MLEFLNGLRPTELEWIKELHHFRGSIVDAFFIFLNFFDRPEFGFILISTVWFCYGWKQGLKLFYILTISGLCNYFLKDIYQLPRPFQLDPSVGIITVKGFTFPSGAAQTAILLPGILLSICRNRWAWVLAINFAFWVSLSRIFLGVHFPSDIIAGWCVGAALLGLYLWGFPFIQKWIESHSKWIGFGLSLGIPLYFLIFHYSLHIAFLCAPVIGVSLGLALSLHQEVLWEAPKNIREGIVCSVIAVLGIFTIVLSIDYAVLKFILAGMWLSYGVTITHKLVQNRFLNYFLP